MESKYDKANLVSNDESENSSFFAKANWNIDLPEGGYQCSSSRIYKV